MADIHVLTGDGNQSWTIVLHLPVPDADNAVSINWRDALVGSGLGGTTQLSDGDGMAGTISAAEKATIESGAVVEHSATLEVAGGGATTESRRATLRALYASKLVTVLSDLQRRLQYYGHIEDKE